MAKILITGFEPFGKHSVNPTQLLVEDLQGLHLSDGSVIQTKLLPVVGAEARSQMIAAIEDVEPDFVINLGQAGRESFCPEKVAVNYANFPIKDNSGAQLVAQAVEENGPVAYFSTLPVEAITTALKGEGIAAQLSMTAGTYVCNYLFYSLMHYLAQQDSSIKGGFIHCPLLPEQSEDGTNTMPYEEIRKAVMVACECCLKPEAEMGSALGALD